MSRYWNGLTKRLEPYTPGEQPQEKGFIKLNTNENPYPPSPKVKEAIAKASADRLRLYPDPECNALREVIADYYRIEKEQVFVGNGSDEILAFAFCAFFEKGRPVLFPDITYSFYPVYCRLFNVDYREVPLNDEFRLRISSFKGGEGVVLANPNAPTGIYAGLDDIRSILRQNRDRVVVLDEAYVDFGGESAIRMVKEFDNLLVVRTASKGRSLAGLRVGWAIGHRELIEGLSRVKNSFNSYTIDCLTMVGTIASFKDEAYFRDTVGKVAKTRERVRNRMEDMGFKVCESKANFLFAAHTERGAVSLFDGLRKKKILVRYFDRPRIENYLRITIGADEQMQEFLEAVESLL